jgi:hypothetical protein
VPVRRRIWCETCPWSELGAPAILQLLAARTLEPIVAVRPQDLGALSALERAFTDAGVRAAYWPMLADEEGRWAAAGNATRFGDFARSVAACVPGRELVVDLEPPIGPSRDLTEVIGERAVRRGPVALRAAAAVRAVGAALEVARRISPRDLARARAELARLVEDLALAGTKVSACVLPPLVLDRRSAWQTLFGTPLAGPRWHEVHVMLYSSMLEGWSRGLLRRQDARALLSRFAAATQRALGTRGSVALGVVGTGAFGDEPVYRDVHELADDVTLARAAGIEQLSLFDLGGVLRRERPEVWLDAFTADGSTADDLSRAGSVRSLRATAIYGLAGVVGGV